MSDAEGEEEEDRRGGQRRKENTMMRGTKRPIDNNDGIYQQYIIIAIYSDELMVDE